ncbi:2-keto-4-pentenoate hydratase [Paraburkholderia sp. BL27I4N3]|uniref:2-keto-4-pentenoate hydratase n=1 Tax=Paraburkholderia sp. BL27I4N3 TaxID=1938805 RepID=UPI000E232E7D|nr:fumarylacetoacetate hydrolase family protein [Paraburkholderia sp. BL27I4N3]REE06612.1 2-keto-4-pentenoate hydratase [Paraburkholderia sp. BL27I4N3]
MGSVNVAKAAEALLTARNQRQTIPPISDTFDIRGLDDAYAVAELNTKIAVAHGRRITGKKIGLTSTAVQKQLGVDQPDFGVLFDDMEFVSGAELAADRLLQPKAEGEIAFVFGRDLNEVAVSWGQFLTSIEFVLPAIEIVDSAIADWKITLSDTIADNASCGLYVLGATPRLLTDLDLAACTMQFKKSDEIVSEGNGAACMGNPLFSAWWLAKTLARLGQPLNAGDVVLSGALGPMFPIRAGDRLEVEIGGLGQVSCRIA